MPSRLAEANAVTTFLEEALQKANPDLLVQYRGLPDDLAVYLDSVSAVSDIPVCAGFGIREAADVTSVGEHASGAIVGSALVEVLESGEDPRPFLRSLGGK